MLRLSLLFTIIFTGFLFAGWTPGLQDAVRALSNGTATQTQKILVHIHRAEVSQMGLSNSQFQNIAAEADRAFILRNNARIQRVADRLGFIAETKAPKRVFTPGSDTDVNLIPKDPNHIITLEDIKAFEAEYEKSLRAECKNNGLDYDEYKKTANTDTDAMAHPDYTDDKNFKLIADHINNEKGGTAYNTRDAARAELKLAKGETPTPDEIGAYTREMKWQMNRKSAKTNKLYKELAAAEKANDFSSIQKISTEIKLVNGQKAKYISKTRQLNNQIRKSYGLEPEPYAIDGADAASDILTAPGGRAAPFSNEASLVGATSDSAMLRAQEKLADSLIEAAQKAPAARRALSGILNDLPPSAQGNMISRMEQELGAAATSDVIKGAKALKAGTNPVLESIKQSMRNDLNFGFRGPTPKPKWKGMTKGQKVKTAAKYGLRVAMIGATAFFMGQDGVYHALNEVTANQTDADFVINVYKNAIYYGSGFGYGFDQANKEMQRDYERQLQRGETSSLMKDITVTGIKTVVYMGKNIVVGTMMLPDVIYEYLTGTKEAQRKEEISKQFLAAVQNKVKANLHIKNAEKIGKKAGIHAEDMQEYIACACYNSECSMMWHSYKGNGVCACEGPLSGYEIPISTSKKVLYGCINQITKKNYEDDLKIFDEMRASDAKIAKKREFNKEKKYQKLLKIIQEKNAKAVEKDLQKVKQLMQKDETLTKAAELFNRIKDSLYKKDRYDLGGKFWEKLVDRQQVDIAHGNIKDAIYSDALAHQAYGYDYKPNQEYIKWEKSWSEARSKLFPKIDSNTSHGNLITAKRLLKNLSIGMGMSRKYPYADKDPKYLAMKERFQKKEQEYTKTLNDSYQKIAKYVKEPDPRSALKLTKKLLDDWQHEFQRTIDLKRNIASYEKLVKLAKQHYDSAEMYKKQKNYSNAIKHYRASLSYQKDSSIQRKLDDLLKRHKVAVSLQKDGDTQLKKKNLSKAIHQYERSVKYWPNSDLQNLINRLKQQLEQEKRKAELEAKIAKLEREKARQEEEAMTSAGLDFGNRFGARESRRTEQVQEKQNRDVYAGNSERADDQEEMLKRLKQNLEKIKATIPAHVAKPVKSAWIPPKTSPLSSGADTTSSTATTQPSATANPTQTSQPGQNTTKPTGTSSNVHTTGNLRGTWRGKSSCCTTSGTFTMQLYNKGKVFIVTKGDMDTMFNGTINKSGTIKVAFITPENQNFRLDGRVKKNTNGNYTGKGTWSDDEFRGTWIVTGGKDVTQATKPVSTPSQTTSTSNTVRDGLYTGTYTDEHLNTRNKKCQNHSGKLSVIVKGNRFSGDGSGTIDATGHLKGTFNNGYKANGAYFPNLKHNGVAIYDVIMGLISGPPYCTAALDLRKDRTGRKTYTPAKKVAKPVKTTLINGSFEANSNNIKTWAKKTSLSGWHVERGSIDIVGGGLWRSTHGQHSLDLCGTSCATLTQTIATVPGKTYTLRFDLAGNPDKQNVKNLQVKVANINKTFIIDSRGKSRTNMQWQRKSIRFTATSGSTKISFIAPSNANQHSWGPVLDNIQIK